MEIICLNVKDQNHVEIHLIKIIESSTDWNEYTFQLSEEKEKCFGIKQCLHDGEPEEFPCIVTSSFHKGKSKIERENYYRAYYKHTFVYEKHARKLLRLVECYT
jgi:hypothetical protein